MQHQNILQNDTVTGARLDDRVDVRRNRLDDDWRHAAQGLLFTGPIISAGIWLCLAAAFWTMFG